MSSGPLDERTVRGECVAADGRQSRAREPVPGAGRGARRGLASRVGAARAAQALGLFSSFGLRAPRTALRALG